MITSVQCLQREDISSLPLPEDKFLEVIYGS